MAPLNFLTPLRNLLRASAKQQPMTAYETGKRYEQLALNHLKKQGLNTLCRNYRCRRGEIDLIMQDQQTIVFVEVRYRRYHYFGSALESIDRKKQQHIIASANHFLLKKRRTLLTACRFDIISCNQTEIHWIKNAFQVE